MICICPQYGCNACELRPIPEMVGLFKRPNGSVVNLRDLQDEDVLHIKPRFLIGENGMMHWPSKSCSCEEICKPYL